MIAKLVIVAAGSALMLAMIAGCEPAQEEQMEFLGKPEPRDYAPAMKEVARRFTGTEGVVLHLGDSITVAAPYTAWARNGRGKAPEDESILQWSHCGERNDLDGWYLASHEAGEYWSYTAAGGVRADQFLAGGYGGLVSLAEMIEKYNPQVAIVMLGTNDAWTGRAVGDYLSDMEETVRQLLDNGTIPILSTIPQMIPAPDLGDQYNQGLWELAARHKLPVIDFHGEIAARQPDGAWNGTLLNKDDPHPTDSRAGVTPESEPTPENLKESGYLLRGWLSVKKLIEVKARVLD